MARRKKNKNLKGIPAAIMLILALIGGFAERGNLMERMSGEPAQNIADTVATGQMKVTYLNVGQGDCTIIQTEGHNAMIDAGNNHEGKDVVDYLNQQGIDKLDYLILTHPDADHIGGGDDVLEKIEVEQVIMPDVANDTMTYEEVMDDIEKENGKHLRYSYWGRMLEMKIARHAQIIKLINQYDIETQEELAKKLEESGFAVTQATISRDIRQLKLTKVPKENGGSHYAVLQNAPSEVGSRYARVLKDAFISVDLAKNVLVIKTVSGMAMAAAAAFDEMNWSEIVGCIGGDDTIFCVARDDDAALVAAERLKRMVDGMEETGEEF